MTKPTVYTATELDTPKTLTYDDAVRILQCGTIDEELGLMRFGSNYTFLVNLQHEDENLLAIYKPRIGERPLWDFPDGTLANRETASYVLSEALGWHIVPPTILKDGTRGIGSVQLFINHDPNRHYFTFDESHLEQVKRLCVFDVLINNADRKGGHCLLDEDERIWGIDQGLSFNTQTKLRTVIWEFAGEPVPQALLNDIQELCNTLESVTDPHYQQLKDLLSTGEMSALQARINQLLRLGVYPMPGAGPNRPWPAV